MACVVVVVEWALFRDVMLVDVVESSITMTAAVLLAVDVDESEEVEDSPACM